MAAVTLVSGMARATTDESTIAERLRPDQRVNVIIANRDGSSRPLSFEASLAASPDRTAESVGQPKTVAASAQASPTLVATASDRPTVFAVAMPRAIIASIPVASRTPTTSAPTVTVTAVAVQESASSPPTQSSAELIVAVASTPAAAPSASQASAAPLPIVAAENTPAGMPALARASTATLVVAAAPFVVVPENDHSFVPTTTTKKPTAHPTPLAALHDLAWLYAHRYDSHPLPNDHSQDLAWLFSHRYDTRAPDDFSVPGVPVRSQVASPFDTSSGAFHGVRANNGWSAVRVEVSIPCGASHFAKGPGRNELTGLPGLIDQETGYIYIGGWGAGPNGAAADAGLQKSSAQAQRDEYAMYWKFDRNRPITSNIRFPCGGPAVVLELYPVTNSLLVFSATGIGPEKKSITLTVVQRTGPKDGWITGGGTSSDGIILKRMVSIAQSPYWKGFVEISRWVDGSYFGVDSEASRTPRIVWRNCEIGRLSPPRIVPQYRNWTDAETWHPTALGIYSDWPPKSVLFNKAGVCDAAGIVLHV